MNLKCSCCGGNAPARRQWYNRDDGYGVCARCFNDAVKKEGIEVAINHYGAPGIHHSTEPERVTINPENLVPAREAMRDREEIERAHDLLVGVILKEINLGYSEEDMQELAKVARVLCWVLCHDHNPEVAGILLAVESAAQKAGYALRRIPQCS